VKDPLQMLLSAGVVPATSFPPNSRYAGVPVLKLDRGDTGPDGADGEPPTAYLGRRLLPDATKLALLSEHSVVQGDRLDLLAARLIGDPELWWRIADANPELDPAELVVHIGRWLRITLPDGVPGVADA
jgi:hypothetical protein